MALGHGGIPDLPPACIAAIEGAVEVTPVYVGVIDFYDSFYREALEDAIDSSEEASAAMAGSNADFPDAPDLFEYKPSSEDLWSTRTEWSIEAHGKIIGEYDPERERMFNGDALNCSGKLNFKKAGRGGLISTTNYCTVGTDDDWRDQDLDAEMEYDASLKEAKD